MESSKTSVNIDMMIACILIYFPLTSSVGELIPFSMNQILVLLLVLLIILKEIVDGKTQAAIIFVLLYVLYFTVNGLVLSTELSLNLENCIYWATTILLLIYLWKERNRIALYNAYQNAQKQMAFSAVVVISINLLGLLFGTNY